MREGRKASGFGTIVILAISAYNRLTVTASLASGRTCRKHGMALVRRPGMAGGGVDKPIPPHPINAGRPRRCTARTKTCLAVR